MVTSFLFFWNYEVKSVDFSSNEQKEPCNGRLPILVDQSTVITIIETAAIITYLTETYDKDFKYSLKQGKEYYKHLELLYFQMAGIGPMQGQANHFVKFAPETIPYGINRYTNETKRLYGVLNEYLQRNEANGPYLVGNHYSVADFALFSWAVFLPFIGIDFKEFPLVTNWMKELLKVPEVVKGFKVPTEYKLPEL